MLKIGTMEEFEILLQNRALQYIKCLRLTGHILNIWIPNDKVDLCITNLTTCQVHKKKGETAFH